MISRNVKVIFVAVLAVSFLWVSWEELTFLVFRLSGQSYPVVSIWFTLAIKCLFIGAGSFAILRLRNLRVRVRWILVAVYVFNMWWILHLLKLLVAYLNGVSV